MGKPEFQKAGMVFFSVWLSGSLVARLSGLEA